MAKDVPDPPGEAALWGTRVHEALEKRIRDKTPLPDSMARYEKLAVPFDRAPGIVLVEQKLCLSKNMQLVDWFSKQAWCRGVIDIAVVRGPKAAAWDWKTGSRKPENEQLKLFAGLVFQAYPEVSVVSTGFVWLKDNRIDKEVFTRDQASEIWRTFLPRVARLDQAFATKEWPAKPSGLCRGWCPVTTCEHWQPRR